MENNKEVKIIADAMLDKKGQEVISLDLREIGTAICDHFVICNADSTTNVTAISDNIYEEMRVKAGRKPARTQGEQNGFWVIMDYGDIVCHIFQTPYREFYSLERLWADAVRTDYVDEPEPAPAPKAGTTRKKTTVK